jgi:hypothetical protein
MKIDKTVIEYPLTEDVVKEYVTEIMSAIIADRDIMASMAFKHAEVGVRNNIVFIDLTLGESLQVAPYIDKLYGLFSIGQYKLEKIMVSNVVRRQFDHFKLPTQKQVLQSMIEEFPMMGKLVERFKLEVEDKLHINE